MLLYSTLLKMNNDITKEEFVKLVIKWNQKSPYDENKIQGLEWDGKMNIRYGCDNLWLEIEEYRNKNIIAVRYEKRETDGVIWDTDYIMNFDELKLSVQLDRSFTEEAMMETTDFSTPYFVAMLIDEGYLVEDNNLPILRSATYINTENIKLLTDVINGNQKYQLPVVYVSRTVANREPLNVRWLCSKLKGVAHVFVQENKNTNNEIRSACDDKNEYLGGVGVYLPNGRHKRIPYRVFEGSDDVLVSKITSIVFAYMNAQKTPLLYTWAGVINSLLSDRYKRQKEEAALAESARIKAENEVAEFMDTFDEVNHKLRKRIDELTRANTSLQLENQGLRAKYSETEDVPILFLGNEEEFYQGEIREMILDVIAEKLETIKERTRRADVLRDILNNNEYIKIRKSRESKVKSLFKGYSSLSASMKQELRQLGFEISEDSKHYKLIYFGDSRYFTTIAKTGGDNREGDNISTTILKDMM